MKCCWFVIPEFMLGLPKYDTGACTAYLMGKLEENGFIVKYTYPNLLPTHTEIASGVSSCLWDPCDE